MSIPAQSPLAWIFGRRSIRVFKPGAVDAATVRQLLEAAMAAPSAAAKDPWRFVVIRNRSTLNRLAEVLSNGEMLHTAALAIVVCGDLEAAHDRQLSYLLQDCAAATENLLLAAHALGLGACWLGCIPGPTASGRSVTCWRYPRRSFPWPVWPWAIPSSSRNPAPGTGRTTCIPSSGRARENGRTDRVKRKMAQGAHGRVCGAPGSARGRV